VPECFAQFALKMPAELADETSAINTTNTIGVCSTVFSPEEHKKIENYQMPWECSQNIFSLVYV